MNKLLAKDAPWRDEILTAPMPVARGQLTLPQTPGLGVDVDWNVVERLALDTTV